MKTGLLYSLLAIITLLIVSSELKERKQVSDVTSTCRLIDTSIQSDCVIVACSNSLKKLNPELVRFRIVHERILRQAFDQKIQLSINKQRLRRSRPENFQGIKPDARIIYNYSTEKEDHHHLL